ncbi:unnamed protein product [Miscanthus lutarioriparius]|uniref:Uncharacterized protein n=1 Tax=Miscanthus lutarioriparius TaxID=422564 RepID=A0A811QU98_9POAL|nr:unnamed protein product [Miscanthus lutarioriparius]
MTLNFESDEIEPCPENKSNWTAGARSQFLCIAGVGAGAPIRGQHGRLRRGGCSRATSMDNGFPLAGALTSMCVIGPRDFTFVPSLASLHVP